jgi:hypothetical protein
MEKTSFVSELGTARSGRWYLEFSLGSRLLIVDFFFDGGTVAIDKTASASERQALFVTEKNLHELLHDPTLTSRSIVFSLVYTFLTTSNLALALGHSEFTIKNVFGPSTGLFPPARRS